MRFGGVQAKGGRQVLGLIQIFSYRGVGPPSTSEIHRGGCSRCTAALITFVQAITATLILNCCTAVFFLVLQKVWAQNWRGG